MPLLDDLKQGAKKASLTAAIGGGLSIVFMGGLHPTRFLGMTLPKAVVAAGALGASSYTADLLVPRVVPWLGSRVGQPAALSKFEGIVLTPLIAGVTVLAFETVFSPQTIAGAGGPVAALMSGAASSVGAYYILDTMSWIKN